MRLVLGVAEEASTGDVALGSWEPTSVEVGCCARRDWKCGLKEDDLDDRSLVRTTERETMCPRNDPFAAFVT